MSKIASAIKAAEAALEKGDYNACSKIVDPLLLDFEAETIIGGQLRLLLITAYLGKGDEQKAINICQTLIRNSFDDWCERLRGSGSQSSVKSILGTWYVKWIGHRCSCNYF